MIFKCQAVHSTSELPSCALSKSLSGAFKKYPLCTSSFKYRQTNGIQLTTLPSPIPVISCRNLGELHHDTYSALEYAHLRLSVIGNTPRRSRLGIPILEVDVGVHPVPQLPRQLPIPLRLGVVPALRGRERTRLRVPGPPIVHLVDELQPSEHRERCGEPPARALAIVFAAVRVEDEAREAAARAHPASCHVLEGGEREVLVRELRFQPEDLQRRAHYGDICVGQDGGWSRTGRREVC